MKPTNLFFIVILVFKLLFADKLLACYCDGGLTFCEATTGIDNDLIVSGEITYVDSIKLRLRIIDIFKGEETKDTITIWAGTDFTCTGLFSMSTSELGQKGDSIIIILPKIDSNNIENAWDVVGDYRRPYYLCITPNLRLEKNIVFGEIKDSWPMPRSTVLRISYDHFKTLWKNGEIDCSALVGVPYIEMKEVDYCINNGHLMVENNENLDLLINIFDQTGRSLFSLKSNSDKIALDPLIDNQLFIILQISHIDRLITNEKIIIKK
jgi:hypothetical protein